jgi:tRNA-splicing endonuclease subunit Sen2
MLLATSNDIPQGHKAGSRRHESNRIYANPLPLLFTEPEPSRVQSVLGLIGLSLTRIQNPHCEGFFDAATRSVWVSNSKDSMILWQRGFFGKGDLSRSEPSWLARQMNVRQTGRKRNVCSSYYIHLIFTQRCHIRRTDFRRNHCKAES